MRALVSTAEWQRSASAYTYGVVGLALKRKEDVGHVTKVRQLLWTRRQLSSIVRRHLCNASPARARACHPRQGRPATVPCASKDNRPASTVSMYSCTSSLAVFVSYWCLIVWKGRPSRRTPLASTEPAPGERLVPGRTSSWTWRRYASSAGPSCCAASMFFTASSNLVVYLTLWPHWHSCSRVGPWPARPAGVRNAGGYVDALLRAVPAR